MPLSQCGQHENTEELIMKCVESICSCSENSAANDYSECRCKAISGLVTQCYVSNSSVELSDWRILYDCRKLQTISKRQRIPMSFVFVFQP